MKCCKCGKELKMEGSEVPREWYGSYSGTELLKVICTPCIRKPENKSDWHKD